MLLAVLFLGVSLSYLGVTVLKNSPVTREANQVIAGLDAAMETATVQQGQGGQPGAEPVNATE